MKTNDMIALLALMGGNGGGSGVQSDWNQTDSAAGDYIKNKPFGSTDTEILKAEYNGVNFTITYGADSIYNYLSGLYASGVTQINGKVDVGDGYTDVTFSVEFNMMMFGYTMSGTVAHGGSNYSINVVAKTGTASPTFSMYGPAILPPTDIEYVSIATEDIVSLDKKFIPHVSWNATKDDESIGIEDKPMDVYESTLYTGSISGFSVDGDYCYAAAPQVSQNNIGNGTRVYLNNSATTISYTLEKVTSDEYNMATNEMPFVILLRSNYGENVSGIMEKLEFVPNSLMPSIKTSQWVIRMTSASSMPHRSEPDWTITGITYGGEALTLKVTNKIYSVQPDYKTLIDKITNKPKITAHLTVNQGTYVDGLYDLLYAYCPYSTLGSSANIPIRIKENSGNYTAVVGNVVSFGDHYTVSGISVQISVYKDNLTTISGTASTDYTIEFGGTNDVDYRIEDINAFGQDVIVPSDGSITAEILYKGQSAYGDHTMYVLADVGVFSDGHIELDDGKAHYGWRDSVSGATYVTMGEQDIAYDYDITQITSSDYQNVNFNDITSEYGAVVDGVTIPGFIDFHTGLWVCMTIVANARTKLLMMIVSPDDAFPSKNPGDNVSISDIFAVNITTYGARLYIPAEKYTYSDELERTIKYIVSTMSNN